MYRRILGCVVNCWLKEMMSHVSIHSDFMNVLWHQFTKLVDVWWMLRLRCLDSAGSIVS